MCWLRNLSASTLAALPYFARHRENAALVDRPVTPDILRNQYVQRIERVAGLVETADDDGTLDGLLGS